MKKIIAGLVGAALVLGVAPAFAGEWRVDQRRCSVQTIDRHDGRGDRYDNGRGNRGDSRYDSRGRNNNERITVCSRSAFFYVPDRRERYSHRYRTPRLSFSYDSRLRLPYRFDGGRKIYVRA